MFDLKGKTALVTGSTQGIGFEIARLLSRQGAKVFIHGGTNMEKCSAASEKIENSTPVLGNLLEKGVEDKLFEATGPVDILVLNASMQIGSYPGEISSDDIDAQFAVNVRSSIMLMQKYAPYMKEKGFGEVACHIAIDDDGAYCANYLSGSAVKMPDKPVRHSGSGKNSKRQEMPHPHGCTITPDKKYVCITDLGTDTICVYDKAMNLYSKANVPEGHGVRHMAFSEDGKYAFTVNELESTVSAFEYGEGELHLLDTVSALPEAFEGENLAAAIRVRNGDIYVSNRGADLIARLEFDGKRLTLCESVPCRGKSPRDFDFVGEFLISTNENSDNVTVFAVSEEYISDMIVEMEIKSPLCIVSVLHKEI